MTNYIDPDELREYIGSDTSQFQTVIDTLCTVASRSVESICDRNFTQDTSATAQYFDPRTWYCCEVDDISTTNGLLVATDDDGSGNYSTSWTLNTDYFLEPVNQRQGPISGWPYTELTVLQTKVFRKQSLNLRPLVKVTAQWGWAAVPEPVKQATLIAAARLFKMKDAPDGFVGLDGWGPVRVRENPEVKALLGPFMKYPVVVA